MKSGALNIEFKAGWKVVVGGAVGMATGCSALPLYTLGVLIAPLSAAFGWGRAEIAAVTLCSTVTNTICLPLVGRAADRFGVRLVVLTSLLGCSLAYLSFLLLNQSVWSLYVCWMLLTSVGAGTYPPFWTRGVAPWFDKHQGLAIGLVLMGSGLSSVIAPPLIGAAVDRFGLDGAFLTLALIPALIGFPAVFALFRPGRTLPTSDGEAEPARPGPVGYALSEALRRRQFWNLGLGIFLGGGAIAAFIVSLIPIATGMGLNRGLALALASELGLAVMAGRILTGVLLDRLPTPLVGFSYFFLSALAVFGMSMDPSVVAMHAFVLIIGLSAGAEVDILTYAVSRYFGLKHYGQICGWLFTLFAIGAGIAPLGAGLVFDQFGSYHLALWIGAACLMVAAVLFATLGRKPQLP